MKKALLSAIALLPSFASMAAQMDKNVLLVGVDGAQLEHIQSLPTPAFDRLNLIKAYAGGINGRFSQQKTSSGPGWATILTGVWVNKHQIPDNYTGPINTNWPSIFRRIHQHDASAEIYSFSTWGTINSQIVSQDIPLLSAHSEGGSDDSSTQRVIDTLQSAKPDFVFIHLDEPDGAGHGHGWGAKYDQSIIDSDRRLGQMLDAVEQREQSTGEDWLVLVTTDHGRNGSNGYGHGNQTLSEKTIFIASNKSLSMQNLRYISVANQDFSGLYNQPAQTSIVPTIIDFMQLSFDPSLDGLSLLSRQDHNKLYSPISGRNCGFEWDADVDSPSILQSSEHVAKFDCGGSADPLLVMNDVIYANIYGSSCGLQWQASDGVPSALDDNEHLAKFDCSDKADPVRISSSTIYTTISGKHCGLEWDASAGTPSTIGSNEHVAKFDCGGTADPITTVPAN